MKIRSPSFYVLDKHGTDKGSVKDSKRNIRKVRGKPLFFNLTK